MRLLGLSDYWTPPFQSELFLAVILWWQHLVLSCEPELELSSRVCVCQR